MIRYALVNAEGLIVQTGAVPDHDHLAMQAEATGLSVVEIGDAEISDATHYWSGAEFVALPASRPGSWAEFDRAAGAWIDPRTQADMAQELQARRASASLPKASFLEACMAVGILPANEAAQAARGIIPDSFAAAVATLSGYEQDMLLIKWAAVSTVRRADPLVLAVAAAAGISDATLDAIFDII